jgi:hypothetical protein
VLNKGKSIDAADPAVLFFRGQGRTYVLIGGEKGAHLSALSTDGRQIWLAQIPAPVPIVASGVEWTLEEPAREKQVILTWALRGERIRFALHTNSGQLLTENRTLADELVPSATPKNADPTQRPATELRVPRAGADLPANTDSQSERLDRLEKAIEDLRKRLQEPAPARNSGAVSGAEFLHANAELQSARNRVARLVKHKDAAGNAPAELDEAKIELDRAEKLMEILSVQIETEVVAAEAAQKIAAAHYERALGLAEKGELSQAEVDAAKAELVNAEARWKQLEVILQVKKNEKLR